MYVLCCTTSDDDTPPLPSLVVVSFIGLRDDVPLAKHSHHLRSWPSFLKRPHALCQPTMQTSSKKEANAATATPSFSVLFGLCYSTSLLLHLF